MIHDSWTKLDFTKVQKCSSTCELFTVLLVNGYYCFRARGIVSVVCFIVLSNETLRDLLNNPERSKVLSSSYLDCSR